jgi:hypothetical protein
VTHTLSLFFPSPSSFPLPPTLKALAVIAEAKYGATDSMARLVYFKIVRFGRTPGTSSSRTGDDKISISSAATKTPTAATTTPTPLHAKHTTSARRAMRAEVENLSQNQKPEPGAGYAGYDYAYSSESSPSPRTQRRQMQVSLFLPLPPFSSTFFPLPSPPHPLTPPAPVL